MGAKIKYRSMVEVERMAYSKRDEERSNKDGEGGGADVRATMGDAVVQRVAR